MICKFCNVEFEEGIFCPECGKKIEDTLVCNTTNESNSGDNSNSFTEGKKKNRIGITALLISIIGLMTSLFVIGLLACILSLILSLIAIQKKGTRKKAAVFGLIFSIIGIFVSGAMIVDILDDPYEVQVDNEVFFEIVDEIKEGNIDNAESMIENTYGVVQYDEIEGHNKMILYHMLYNAQGKYDDEANVLIDYLKANQVRFESKNADIDDVQSILTVASCASDIIDKISDDNIANLIQCIKNSVTSVEDKISDDYRERLNDAVEKCESFGVE